MADKRQVPAGLQSICMIVSLAVSILFVTDSNAQRLRAMNFGLEQVTSDTLHASAHGSSCYDSRLKLSDFGSGTMIYQREIDQTMINQINAVLDVGGTANISFTLRKGLSTVGLGEAFVDGTVTITVAGTTISTITDSGDAPPGGTTSTNHVIPIDADILATMSDGGTVMVSASGSGEAHAYECGTWNQAIASWYFTNGGKPTIGTSPFIQVSD